MKKAISKCCRQNNLQSNTDIIKQILKVEEERKKFRAELTGSNTDAVVK